MWLLSLILAAGALALWKLVPALFIHEIYPWPVYVLLVASIAVAVASRSYISIGVTGLLTVLFLVYTLAISRLDGGQLAVHPGEAFPDFTLQTSTNESFSPLQLKGKSAALYIFYRGDW